MYKPFKTSGICGVLLFVLLVIGFLVYFYFLVSYIDSAKELLIFDVFKISINFGFIIGMVSFPFTILFFYGFIALGKKFENKTLIICGWIFITVTIIGLIMTLIFIFSVDKEKYMDFVFSGYGIDINKTTTVKEIMEINPNFSREFKSDKDAKSPLYYLSSIIFGKWSILLLLILVFLGNMALRLITGIQLIRLRKSGIKSSLAGTFEIISGFLKLSILAILFETILFIRLSKKYEADTISAST